MGYLDRDGLAYLWDKVKNYVDERLGGGGGTILENVVTIDGGGSVILSGDFGEAPYTIEFDKEPGEEPGDSVSSASEISYDKASTGMTADNVQNAIDELFMSGSEGKFLIASAITAKGVNTTAGATFQTMHDNILAIPSREGFPNNIYTVKLTLDPPDSGTVTGGGMASNGMTVTVNAIPNEGNDFGEWAENDVTVSTDKKYTFSLNENRNLKAKFLQNSKTAGTVWYKSPQISEGDYANFTSVGYGGGNYVMFSTKEVYTSSDGVTWQAHNCPDTSTAWKHVLYGNDVFIVTDEFTSYHKYLRSEDGKNWAIYELPTNSQISCAKFLNGLFVILTTEKNEMYISEDGVKWTKTLVGFDNYSARNVTYGNGIYLVFLYDNNYPNFIIASTDRENWVETRNSNINVNVLTFCKGTFFGFYRGIVYTSTDGNDWVGKELPSISNPGSPVSAEYGSGRLVMITRSGDVYYSDDLENWRVLSRATDYIEVSGMGFGKNTFVASTLNSYSVYYSN